MHVALGLLRRERVELLLEPEHVQRGDAEDLGLAALEQRRAVHAREHVDLGTERSDVGETAAVHADLVAEDALAHDLLGQRAERAADLLLAADELLADPLDGERLDVLELGLAVGLRDDRQRLAELVADSRGDRVVRVLLVLEVDRELLRRLRRLVRDLLLGGAEDLDEALRGLETLGDDLLGRGGGAVADEVPGLRGGLGLDHHDRDVAVLDHAAGDDHVERRALGLGDGRERDPLAVDVRDAGGADRAGERQPGDLGGQRRGVDRDDVVEVVGVEREDGLDDLDLVAQPVLERRAQRSVDQAAGEDRALARAALASEERAGDAPDGVHPLLDVDGEREEVELVLGLLRRGRRGQDDGLVIEVGEDAAGGLSGDATGLEPDGALAETAVVDNGLSGMDVGTLHGSPSFAW